MGPSTRLIERIVARSGTGSGESLALIDGDVELTFAQLTQRVESRACDFGLDDRSLVVLAGDRSIEYIVTYLALLHRGHVPLLAGAHADGLAERWDAAAVVTADADSTTIDHRPHEPVALHPDLALLMSTSGTTGSPKLVRLSHDNLLSNAESIAEYLDLRATDRSITSLPLHYCYGLSVLHSHLLVGAGVVATEASVVDPCFVAALERHGVTNVAGVPHTFELLERSGPERLHVPSLRLVTQAGGRLGPDAVRRWIGRTASWGVDFFVMYGQTEATARMAYLPPELGLARPETIGRAIPGGSFHLRRDDDLPEGVGELVYRGPNVMLGYAVERTDLARGRDIDELSTGDLARFHEDEGVFEIVGRRSRFVKPLGLRVDLDAVESMVRELDGVAEVAVGGNDHAVVVMAPGASHETVASVVTSRVGLPPSMVTVEVREAVPRTSSGKVDYAAVADHARTEPFGYLQSAPTHGPASAVLASAFGRHSVARDATFVSLGGDSLSYIECSIRLEQALGHLPRDWHLRSAADLDAMVRPTRPRAARLDTTVLLRAVSICAVVATHMHLWFVPGGAHILLAVVGYNLARFMMPIEDGGDRLRAGFRTVARVAVPTIAWAAVGLMLGVSYGVGTVLLVNNYVGPASHAGDHWHFWFIEVLVHLVVAVTLLLAIPAVRRLERRFPYALPLALLAGTLVMRMEWAWLDDWYNLRFRTHGIAWFFVLGWLVQRSDSIGKKLLTSVLVALLVPDFFRYAPREWFIVVALVALVWFREVPVPRRIVPLVSTVAAASMWILITHFTIWPPLTRAFPLPVAYLATLAAGVVIWFAVDRTTSTVSALARRAVSGRANRRSSLHISDPHGVVVPA